MVYKAGKIVILPLATLEAKNIDTGDFFFVLLVSYYCLFFHLEKLQSAIGEWPTIGHRQ